MTPDPAARLTALYERHHRQVYAYAVSRAGRPLADDVVSETYLVAWRRLADVPAQALPWLLGVARNVMLERYRDQARQAGLAEEMARWVREADDVADGVTERAAALSALSWLPDRDREILTLTAWHGLTTGQAAQVLGCSRATFLVRLHRARKRFAQVTSAQSAVATSPSTPRRVTDEQRVAAAG